jgi:hypothetical protein
MAASVNPIQSQANPGMCKIYDRIVYFAQQRQASELVVSLYRRSAPLQAFSLPANSKRLRGSRIEKSRILAYDNHADEFVRLSCRDCAGWRRDEWAYSPLFIWAKTVRVLG